MVEQAFYSAGTGKCRADLMAAVTGDGLVVQLYGGDKPHVGAVAISLPRPSRANAAEISCSTSVIPLLGHKDDEVAKPVAEKIAKAVNQPVVVIAGIHVDNATLEEIEKIVENCHEAARRFIAGLPLTPST